jgi:hypothetical protein
MPPPTGVESGPLIEARPSVNAASVGAGGRSRVFDEADRQRLFSAAERSGGRLSAHVLERAAHWVHVDDPEGLLALVASSM